MEHLLTAEEYLSHSYELPKIFPELPLADEKFICAGSTKENFEVLNFLSEEFTLPVEKFDWNNVAALKIELKQTLGGRLPIIATANHDDFCQMVALLTAREAKKYPLTVNAFTIPCRAEKIYREGGSKCDGRLNFYCQKVLAEELPKIYRAVDRYLDEVELITKKSSNEFEIFKNLASRAIKL